MAAYVANARAVAEWLAADPRVSYVRWAGLPDHPHHDRARRYLPLGPGAVFSQDAYDATRELFFFSITWGFE
ncbi:MAG: PLP-dependent transferase [Pseudonocardiales bacterium]|nr:PLP-dependent transferase [Pseudonocardiales bacterium]